MWIFSILVGIGVFTAFRLTRKTEAEYFTAKVEQGDIHQIIEATGTINPVTRGLRPAKVDENGFENEAFLKAVGAAKVGVTVELLRPLPCLIRSMRVERINGRSLCSRGATIARDPA